MSTKIPGTKDTDYKIVPAGMHHGILFGLYDLGTHWREYRGEGKWDELIVMSFEFPKLRIEIDDKNMPMMLSTFPLTKSLHKKANLRKLLESWRNKEFSEEELSNGFEMGKLMGVNGTIQVAHKRIEDRSYANIVNVMPLVDKSAKKEPENPLTHFQIEEMSAIPETVPNWVKDKIKNSREWLDAFEDAKPTEEYPPVEEYDDEVPF